MPPGGAPLAVVSGRLKNYHQAEKVQSVREEGFKLRSVEPCGRAARTPILKLTSLPRHCQPD